MKMPLLYMREMFLEFALRSASEEERVLEPWPWLATKVRVGRAEEPQASTQRISRRRRGTSTLGQSNIEGRRWPQASAQGQTRREERGLQVPSSTVLSTPRGRARRARAIFFGVHPPLSETIYLFNGVHPYYLHSQLAYTPSQPPRRHWHLQRAVARATASSVAATCTVTVPMETIL